MSARLTLAEHIAAFEERAGVLEYDHGMPRAQAEMRAAQDLGGRPAWSGTMLRVIDAVEAQR